MMENKGIFSAMDLAKFLNYFHKSLKGKNISPLKLQKTLFFLFGEWGAFVARSSNNDDGDWTVLKDYPKYLFMDPIEAWLYGPVVREVYSNFNNEELTEEQIFNDEQKIYAGEFIKDLATELFNLSDFRLVELSHQMNCWKDNFDSNNNSHKKIIDKDTIINEFLLQL